MTLQSSGEIDAADINVELTRSSTDEFNEGGDEERKLAKIDAGIIAHTDFYGKENKVGGSEEFTIEPTSVQNYYTFPSGNSGAVRFYWRYVTAPTQCSVESRLLSSSKTIWEQVVYVKPANGVVLTSDLTFTVQYSIYMGSLSGVTKSVMFNGATYSGSNVNYMQSTDQVSRTVPIGTEYYVVDTTGTNIKFTFWIETELVVSNSSHSASIPFDIWLHP